MTKVQETDENFSATLGQVAESCDGHVDARVRDVVVSGVSTDTRRLSGGELFVALEGTTHDGHDFLDRAVGCAAAALVSDSDAAPGDLPVVIVDDTLLALGRLAAWHRSRMPARVAAVTGSTGKTSTKDMLGEIMQRVGPSVVAEGTHNNQIGEPLTLLKLDRMDQFCVLELAMRGPGEIEYLAEIARPDVGVITNIGQSHVGRLGSREGIAQAKAELLDHLPPDGTAVLNADDFFFNVFRGMSEAEVVSFGIDSDADFTASLIDDSAVDTVRFRMLSPLGEADVQMNVPGRHNVMNALAAGAAATGLGAGMDDIVGALESFSGSEMRMQSVTGAEGALVLNDAYNASPASVAAALRVLETAPGRKVFVFGDMLEMGAEGEAAHREVGRAVADAGVDWLIAVGKLARLAAEEAAGLGVRTATAADPEDVVDMLHGELGEGDTVLVKASRGMALERVVEGLADGN